MPSSMGATSFAWKYLVVSCRALSPPTFYCLDRRGRRVVSWTNQCAPICGCRCDVSDTWTVDDFVGFMVSYSNKCWQWPDVVLVDSIE